MKQDISLEVDIPPDFTVISAVVTIYHTPAYWQYQVIDYNTGMVTTYYIWGHSRNLKLYKAISDTQNYKFNMAYGSSYEIEDTNLSLSEIPNAFRATTYTPANESGSSIEKKDSIDISSYINTAGKHKLVIRTEESVPDANDYENACGKTGMVRAVINVIGYKSIVEQEE